MDSSKLAALLLRHPEASVLMKVGDEWYPVIDVVATGEHRNAVTFKTDDTPEGETT